MCLAITLYLSRVRLSLFFVHFFIVLIYRNKVIARKTNVDHGDSYLQFDGYMTAWFMWQLQGDTEAAKAFVGNDAEILNNTLYQDQKSNCK